MTYRDRSFQRVNRRRAKEAIAFCLTLAKRFGELFQREHFQQKCEAVLRSEMRLKQKDGAVLPIR
jgi:hypothetical protein